MGQPQSQDKEAGLRPEGPQAQIKGPVGPGLHPEARAAARGRLSQARGSCHCLAGPWGLDRVAPARLERNALRA